MHRFGWLVEACNPKPNPDSNPKPNPDPDPDPNPDLSPSPSPSPNPPTQACNHDPVDDVEEILDEDTDFSRMPQGGRTSD
eukprot:scaffold79861_cov31-Phaeocystis_antarctica.AAC.1